MLNPYWHYLHFDRYSAIFYNVAEVISLSEEEKRKHRCCFTGHRPQKLTRSERRIKKDLEKAILEAVSKGYTTFITGMAYGVDLWAGEIVVRLRGEIPNFI